MDTARQQAKAVNFGLLYGQKAEGLRDMGITNYGLSWTLKEARQACESWFNLYPEFRLHQWYVNEIEVQSFAPGGWVSWDNWQKLLRSDTVTRIYRTKTISDRPLVIFDGFTKALNYQNQGTGADILANAISCLPGEIAKLFCFPVHDELVFEVPDDQLNSVRDRVRAVMIESAQRVLGTEIPVSVETSVGQSWGK